MHSTTDAGADADADAGAEQRSRLTTLLHRVAWIAGVALFALVALVALNRLADRVVAFLAGLGAPAALPAAAGVLAWAVLAIGLVVGMERAARRVSPGAVLAIGLGAVAVAQAVVAVIVDAPLVADWLAYHEAAIEIAAEGPALGDRPIGYPALLAVAYRLFGAQTWVAEALNVGAGLLAATLLFDLLRRAGGVRVAAVGIGLFAGMPSLALMTPVVSTEPMYGAMILLVAWAVAVPGVLIGALAAGATLGLSQYVRPSSFVLLPAIAVAVAIGRERSRLVSTAAVVVAFLLALSPVIADNLAQRGELSLATSSFGGFGILVGTNQAADGRFNEADAELLRTLPGDTLRERSDAAGRLGVQRITEDPIGFAGLAVRKFAGLWSDDGYAAFYALGWQRASPLPAPILAGANLASQLAWVAVTILAAWGVWRSGPRPPAWLLTTILVAGSVTLLHAVVEVQPRYHAYLAPLWIGVAAMGLVALADRRRNRAGHTAADASV
ncbi:MAG: glycosyltransferase family 39 protein [Candidatus Limnocylindria bacterium]